MIKAEVGSKSVIANEVANIISNVSSLKFEREYELSTQQKEWLEQSLVSLKKVLAEAVR